MVDIKKIAFNVIGIIILAVLTVFYMSTYFTPQQTQVFNYYGRDVTCVSGQACYPRELAYCEEIMQGYYAGWGDCNIPIEEGIILNDVSIQCSGSCALYDNIGFTDLNKLKKYVKQALGN